MIKRNSDNLDIRQLDLLEKTITVVAATEQPVARDGYQEVLRCSPDAVTIAAASVLFNHSPMRIIGKIVETYFSDGKLFARIAFSETELGREIQQLVQEGCLRGVSVGYSIEEYQQDGDTIIATRWTLREISLTPTPADLEAQILERIAGVEQTRTHSNTNINTHNKEHPMDVSQIEKLNVDITTDVREKKLDEVVDGLRRGQRLSAIYQNVRAAFGLPQADVSDIVDGVVEAFRHFDSKKLHQRAVLTSANFGNVTALAAAKAAVDSFKRYTPEWPKFCKEIFVPDFNTVTVAGVNFSNFVPQPSEGADYPDATVSTVGVAAANQFLGQNVEISLQAIYNDRTSQILEYFSAIGRTAARTLDEISQTALASASWTAATQSLAFSEANLGIAYGAHAATTIPGIPAKVLIVPMGLYVPARNATTWTAGAPAGRVLADAEADGLTVVRGWYLSDPDDWYLAADPADAPVVVLLRHPDYVEPRIVQKGEGGGPNLLLRVDFPARAVVVYQSANKPLAAHRFTA